MVLPIFFLAILAMVEFGRAMMVGQLVTNAAREGARRAILPGSDRAEVETHITDFLRDAGSIDPGAVTVTMTVEPGPTRDGRPPTGLLDADSGDRVTVDVSVPWDEASWGVLRWLGGQDFQASATMRHE